MAKDNLKFKVNSFDANRNAWLVDAENPSHQIFVPAAVLQKAFITRAWLDRTLINCAVGSCRLGADVEQRGNRLEATKVWLALEKSVENESRGNFKNFGLELSKPPKGSPAFLDMTSLEKVLGKLAKRFLETEDANRTKSIPDLCNFRFDNIHLLKLAERHLKNAQALTSKLVVCEVTPDWRLVTGMGEASVYETNMTLHHVYGIPYIPASSIKGVLRHYLSELEEGKNYIEHIFGEGDEKSSDGKPIRGQCTFFDAFPLKAPRIELDVMTPHYQDYYTGDKPPADWLSPNPIHFLTVGQGTPFRFMVGLPDGDDSLKSKLEVWLKEALETRGIGAKTSVGYGYWKNYSS